MYIFIVKKGSLISCSIRQNLRICLNFRVSFFSEHKANLVERVDTKREAIDPRHWVKISKLWHFIRKPRTKLNLIETAVHYMWVPSVL